MTTRTIRALWTDAVSGVPFQLESEVPFRLENVEGFRLRFFERWAPVTEMVPLRNFFSSYVAIHLVEAARGAVWHRTLKTTGGQVDLMSDREGLKVQICEFLSQQPGGDEMDVAEHLEIDFEFTSALMDELVYEGAIERVR